MTWFEAKEHCEKERGKLVEIDSEEENTALVDEINGKGYTDRNMNFWIGLTDLESEGDWRLASNGLKPSYLNWGWRQPNNRGENENCARIKILSLPGFDRADTWSDIDCNSTKGYHSWISIEMHALCEFDRSRESPSTESSTTEDTTTGNATTEGTSTKS